MAPHAVVTSTSEPDPELIHETWQRACRVDDLLSRLGEPPDALPLVRAILERLRTGTRPPNAVLQAHANGLSAPQWGLTGEVVPRQIGLLMMTVAEMVPGVDPHLMAEIHMETAAAASAVSLTAWRSQAETDSVTGLRNELGLETDLERLVAQGEVTTIAFIDLDGLKQVNTEQGHAAGSDLIRSFGRALSRVVRQAGGQAYRPHGDEFIVTMPSEEGSVVDVLDELLGSGEVAFSYGVAEWPTDDLEIKTVQRIADKAMYEMKAAHHSREVGSSRLETSSEAAADPLL